MRGVVDGLFFCVSIPRNLFLVLLFCVSVAWGLRLPDGPNLAEIRVGRSREPFPAQVWANLVHSWPCLADVAPKVADFGPLLDTISGANVWVERRSGCPAPRHECLAGFPWAADLVDIVLGPNQVQANFGRNWPTLIALGPTLAGSGAILNDFGRFRASCGRNRATLDVGRFRARLADAGRIGRIHLVSLRDGFRPYFGQIRPGASQFDRIRPDAAPFRNIRLAFREFAQYWFWNTCLHRATTVPGAAGAAPWRARCGGGNTCLAALAQVLGFWRWAWGSGADRWFGGIFRLRIWRQHVVMLPNGLGSGHPAPRAL